MNAAIEEIQVTGAMADVQAGLEERCIPIQRVGIKDLRHPLSFTDRFGSQNTAANCSFYVSLAADQRGTHMSRFVAIMKDHYREMTIESFSLLPKLVAELLEAESSRVELSFTLFRWKTAPVSGIESVMDYQVKLIGEYRDQAVHTQIQVDIPVTSLCPCSKKISKYGAHNQRSLVSLTIEAREPVWIEDIIEIAERNASAEVFSLVKREDEKYLTEHAYENPKFVEDMVRDLALALERDKRVSGYRVETENFESIHNHSAYALIDKLA